jgi:hypothetical protein
MIVETDPEPVLLWKVRYTIVTAIEYNVVITSLEEIAELRFISKSMPLIGGIVDVLHLGSLLGIASAIFYYQYASRLVDNTTPDKSA